VREAVKIIRECGIKPHVNLIFGFEEDTADSMRATQDFAIELEGCEPYFYVNTPFPGSESFNLLAAADRLLTRDYFYYFWWYPDTFERKNVTNDEVWEFYLQAMDYWDGWKIQGIPG
jgi:radical SAM superfamily enzyme YgiQ (UPF0313 family)